LSTAMPPPWPLTSKRGYAGSAAELGPSTQPSRPGRCPDRPPFPRREGGSGLGQPSHSPHPRPPRLMSMILTPSDPRLPTPDGRLSTPDALWYKDAIIYELHVRAFFDSNADGIGDFRGLIEKLDYL